MKFNKYILGMIGTGIFYSATAFSSTVSTGDALKELYDVFFGETTYLTGWQIDGGWGAPKYPKPYKKYFKDTSTFIDSGTYLSEPVINLSHFEKWSDYHQRTCPDSRVFKKMPITNSPNGYSHYKTYGGKSVKVKNLTVNQNVPYRFKAKKHGGLSNYMSDSFYFWNFGDGMRRFNKKGDDYSTSYSYPFIGSYVLSSIVYSEEWTIGIQVSGDLNGDFTINDTRVKELIKKHGSIYLEGCDVALVNVVKNHAPRARASAYKISPDYSHYTNGDGFGDGADYFDDHDYRIVKYRLSGEKSTDPDSNPLTYTWTYKGKSKTGKSILFNFSRPSSGKKIHTFTLSVTDGDKSSTTNISVTVKALRR